MKTTRYIILLGLLFTSCIDGFEPNTSSFHKVYGNNLDASLNGILATSDNGFLLYGKMDKSIQSYPGNTGKVITLLKTDALGNEKWQKSIGLGDVTFINNPNLIGLTSEISEITYIMNIIELQNGNFFIATEFILPGFGFDAVLPGYIVLNAVGKILEYNTLLDNVVDSGYQLQNQVMYRLSPFAYKIPGSSDILITFTSRFLKPDFNYDSNRFLSMYRLKENSYQEPIWILDNIGHLPDEQKPHNMTFDTSGNIVIIGSHVDGGEGQCFRIFISKINTSSGNLIMENIITPSGELHQGASVIPYNNGYAIQELRNSPGQGCRWQAINDPTAKNIGGVRYVSDNLVTDTLVYSTLPEMSYWGTLNFLETFDNGLVFGFGMSGEIKSGTYISKISKEGKMIWEYQEPNSPFKGNGIYQTPDGGIVFGSNMTFSGANKWRLTKLTKDGIL